MASLKPTSVQQADVVESPSDQRTAPTKGLRERVEQAMVQAAEKVIAEELGELPPVGTSMTMSEAGRAFGVTNKTVGNWVDYGWVTVLQHGSGRGSPTYVDAHDVAHHARTWNRKSGPHRKVR